MYKTQGADILGILRHKQWTKTAEKHAPNKTAALHYRIDYVKTRVKIEYYKAREKKKKNIFSPQF